MNSLRLTKWMKETKIQVERRYRIGEGEERERRGRGEERRGYVCL
jgi:hypothetical protein